MPTFLFYPYLADGRCLTFTVRRLPDDVEALHHAEAVLLEHASAERVAVWQGERPVGARTRQTLSAPPGEPRVLIVEDCFLQAQIFRSALQDAGYSQVECCGDSASAVAWLNDCEPTVAIVDVNLGQGLDFTVADALRRRAVPFLFVTGYDQALIPGAFGDVNYVCKPASGLRVVEAVRETLHRSHDPSGSPAGACLQS